MVSTRQMSIVGGGSTAPPSTSAEHSEGRVSRHGASPPPPPPAFATVLLDLPAEIFEKIFGYLKHKTVAHMRMVCRQMNNICGSYLNSSFQRLVSQTFNEFQAIKSKMPRRESARRNHSLACEFDVIETVHMRLSLLQMTFGKHIERKYCCFFPGEILDEVNSILDYLKVTTKLARPFKLTDELFDLSTMAMEFFKEHMEPNLPEITYFGTEFFDLTGTFSPADGNKSYLCMDSPPPSGSNEANVNSEETGALMRYEEDYFPPSPPPPQSNMVLRKRIHRIKQGMKRYNNQLSALRSDLRSCKRKAAWQQKQIAEHQRLLADQQKQTIEYASRLDEHDKKNEETLRKFQTILQELNKCRTELQYWRSKSPAATPATLCSECGVPSIMQQFNLEQYMPEEMVVGRLPTVLNNGRPPSPQVVILPTIAPPPLPIVEEIQVVETPSSSTRGASTSTGKIPSSPKARKSTNAESKSNSSDEGCSKRSAAEPPLSPPDHKKRRFHRLSKHRKQ